MIFFYEKKTINIKKIYFNFDINNFRKPVCLLLKINQLKNLLVKKILNKYCKLLNSRCVTLGFTGYYRILRQLLLNKFEILIN